MTADAIMEATWANHMHFMLCSEILRVPRHVWLHAKLRNDEGESDLPNRAARRDWRNPVAKPCCEHFQNNTA